MKLGLKQPIQINTNVKSMSFYNPINIQFENYQKDSISLP